MIISVKTKVTMDVIMRDRRLNQTNGVRSTIRTLKINPITMRSTNHPSPLPILSFPEKYIQIIQTERMVKTSTRLQGNRHVPFFSRYSNGKAISVGSKHQITPVPISHPKKQMQFMADPTTTPHFKLHLHLTLMSYNSLCSVILHTAFQL